MDGGGNGAATQLYGPYGSARYQSGTLPTSYGYTHQRVVAATGLDYYHASYYEPMAQQSVSADTVRDGLSRYGYAGGNPTTMVDPSGRRLVGASNSCTKKQAAKLAHTLVKSWKTRPVKTTRNYSGGPKIETANSVA